MAEVHLLPVLRDLGTKSVRQMMASTGRQDQSVSRQAQAAAMNTFYRKAGAFRSGLGLPLHPATFGANNNGEQRFAGGTIQFQNVTPQGKQDTEIRVRFVGFHCIAESDHDQLSGSDEPYFIIGVAGSNGSNTVRFGPYENIESGTDRFEAGMLANPIEGPHIAPPIVIAIAAYEHDEGTPEEAEEKVRNAVKEIENKFEQALASFGAVQAGSHVLPEWARDILIGWVPEAAAAILGLGDDEIGRVPAVMFDFDPGLDRWKAPQVIGRHGENDYNKAITVDGGSEGKYELRFLVDIFDPNIPIRERQP